jgi:hypothetical protein
LTADREYYDSLIKQGYSPNDALYYTRQYFPQFSVQTEQMNVPVPVNTQQTQYGQSYANQQFIHASQLYHHIPIQQRKKNTKLWIGLGVAGLAICIALVVIIASFASSSSSISSRLLVETPEFGFRHDVNPSEYENLGANRLSYDSGEQYPDFSSTVNVYGDDLAGDGWTGSGVIISEYWILTAAHVVEDLIASQTGIYVGEDVGYGEFDYVYSIRNIHVHPGWAGDSELMVSGVDIALIELDEPIRTWESSIAIWDNISSTNRLNTGTIVYTSGYGAYDEGYSECTQYCLDDGDGEYSQRRAWSNVLDRVSDGIIPEHDYDGDDIWHGGWVIYDFDSPSGEHNSLASGESFTIQQGSYAYAGDGDSDKTPLPLEGTTVQGDSGGPTYAYLDGVWTVIGITSHGSLTANYGDVAFNTRVSSHTNWICSFDNVETPIDGC